MKETTFGNKMRWIAGGLYALLAVYQMYLVKPVLVAATPTNVYFTWLYAILLMVGAAVMAVWLFHGREDLSPGTRRSVVVGSAFCVILELMTYSDQTDLINYTVYNNFPEQVNNTTLLYGLMVGRLLLLILAAFFVTSSRQPDKKHLVVEGEEVDAEETVEEKESPEQAVEETVLEVVELTADTDAEVIEVVEVIEIVEDDSEEETAEVETKE